MKKRKRKEDVEEDEEEDKEEERRRREESWRRRKRMRHHVTILVLKNGISSVNTRVFVTFHIVVAKYQAKATYRWKGQSKSMAYGVVHHREEVKATGAGQLLTWSLLLESRDGGQACDQPLLFILGLQFIDSLTFGVTFPPH